MNRKGISRRVVFLAVSICLLASSWAMAGIPKVVLFEMFGASW